MGVIVIRVGRTFGDNSTTDDANSTGTVTTGRGIGEAIRSFDGISTADTLKSKGGATDAPSNVSAGMAIRAAASIGGGGGGIDTSIGSAGFVAARSTVGVGGAAKTFSEVSGAVFTVSVVVLDRLTSPNAGTRARGTAALDGNL